MDCCAADNDGPTKLCLSMSRNGRKYNRCCLAEDEARYRCEKQSAERVEDDSVIGGESVADRALRRVNAYKPPRPK